MEQVGTQNQITMVSGDNTRAVDGTNDDGFGQIYANGVYNAGAHFALEKRRVERDMTIPQIVDEFGEETCDFVQIESRMAGTQVVLIYHPNPKAELVGDLVWVSVPALFIRNKGRFYREASNKRIIWEYKVLRGPLLELIDKVFVDDLTNSTYINEKDDFALKAARFIENYPHETATTYGVYICFFKNLISEVDVHISPVILEGIMVAIAVNLKRVLDYKDKDLPEMEIYTKVCQMTTRLCVQDCSKKVHYKLGLVDKAAQQAKVELAELSVMAEKHRESERMEKQAKIEEMKARRTQQGNKLIQGSKRKIEEVEDNNNDEPATKVARTDE